jgi:hypothetical protein
MAESTWLVRELPILEAVAAATEASEDDVANATVVERSGLSEQDVRRGLRALYQSGHLDALDASTMGEPDEYLGLELTEKGRRAVGQWPSADGALDALMSVLHEREQAATSEDERSRWAQLAAAVASFGRDAGVNLAAAWLAKISGAS